MVKQLVIDHRQAWHEMSECLYDLYVEAPVDAEALVLINAFTTPEAMRHAFKDGFTLLLVPSLTDKIEKYVKTDTPYVIVFKKGASVWAVISYNDVEY